MRLFGYSYLQSSSPALAIIVRCLFCAAVLMLTATPLCAAEQELITSLRSSVFALNSARETAVQELANPSLSTREVSDYRDFVVYLNTRIINYCRELVGQGGTAALEGLPCPADAMTSGTGAAPTLATENIFYTPGPGTETLTQAEKTAELDGEFLATLGEFDEMLLREEDKVATRVPSQRESTSSNPSGSSGSNGGTGGAGKASSGEASENGKKAEDAEGDSSANGQDGQSGDATGAQNRAGAGNSDVGHSTYGTPGGKLPPPKDDDIVARQLREAAEKEPDPELKKKLWEEYWKYKGVRR
jgi:hypothetical protein